MRPIILTEDHKAHIKAIALQTPSVEICGVITPHKIIALTNKSANPEESFEFDVDEWMAVSGEAIAIYHTHCSDDVSGYLSPGDVENSRLFGLPYALYHTRFDSWDYYDPKHTHPYPMQLRGNQEEFDYYLGWPFEWGRSDCAALVRGFFEGFLQLPVGAFQRVDFAHLEGDRTFTHALEGAGFVDVSDLVKDYGLMLYDVPLMSLRSGNKGEHIGIVYQLEPMPRMLHHVGGDRLSETLPYSPYWESKTLRVFRHKNLL